MENQPQEPAIESSKPSPLSDAAAWGICLQHLAQGNQTMQLADEREEVHLCEILCRLLATSQHMASLINAACAGSLDCAMYVTASSSPAVGRWLAKHGRLMRLFTVDAPSSSHTSSPHSIEPTLAAGLDVCTHRRGSSNWSLVPFQLSVLDPPPEWFEPPASPQGMHADSALLVQEVSYTAASDGTILQSLAGSHHLTQLRMSFSSSIADAPGCQSALASLTALQLLELDTRYRKPSNPPSTGGQLADLAPAFRALTQLTHLAWDGHEPLTQHCLDHLPPSLLELKYFSRGLLPDLADGLLNFGNLTGLTWLKVGTILPGDTLPPALQQLQASSCSTLEPVSALRSLRSFVLRDIPTAKQCKLLQAVPTLEEVRVGPGSFSSPGHATAGPELAQLPLVSARFGWSASRCVPANMVANLGSCTQLTELELHNVTVDATWGQLAAALVPLVNLSYAALVFVGARGAPQFVITNLAAAETAERLPDMQALVRALSGLPKLDFLGITGVWLGPAALEFKPGPSLKGLRLTSVGLDAKQHSAEIRQLRARLASVQDFYCGGG
jgi:hypothetical protein